MQLDPATGYPIDPATNEPMDPATFPSAQAAPAAAPAQSTGGVIHGIVGTLLVSLVSLVIALPIGILAGIFLSEYPDTGFSTFVRFCSDVLSGAPSIVIGVVGYVLIVRTTKTYSGLAGSIALTFLMVPTITRTTEEILKLVPNAVREAATAMGAPVWYGTLTVVVPTALSGIVTGALLAFARSAGETAPLLLTIQGNTDLSFNLFQPLAALPLLTYRYIESPFPSENQLAWGTAFVLMMLVLVVNLAVRLVTSRLKGGR
jgi:phosphate transport system permease protein